MAFLRVTVATLLVASAAGLILTKPAPPLAGAVSGNPHGAHDPGSTKDAAAAAPVAKDKKNLVKVQIHYEAMCPYCEELLDNGMRKVWDNKELRSRVEWELVPFGNGMTLTKDRISLGYQHWHPDAQYPVVICQHGERECLGNAMQTCALQDYPQETTIPWVLCMSNYSARGAGIEMASLNCAEETTKTLPKNGKKLNMTQVKECVDSQRGRDLVVALGVKATDPGLNRSYVPWVVADGEHLEIGESHDLMFALCNKLDNPKPKACKNLPAPEAEPEVPKMIFAEVRTAERPGRSDRKKVCHDEGYPTSL